MKNLRISETCRRSSVLLLVLAISLASWGVSKKKYALWKNSVCERIDSLLSDSMFDVSQTGICIYDLTDNSFVYSHNELQTMRPASTQKIITAVTALDALNAAYRLRTSLSYTGSIKESTLCGSLFCKGGFDPLLDDSDLIYLAHELKDCGIDTIRGTICIDKSMKDNSELGEGWCWDDDNPSLSPLTVNGEDNFLLSMINTMSDAGIVVDAVSDNRCTPDSAKVLCETYHTVEDVLFDMMKESNNFHAEALFYNIAASLKSHGACARDAVRAIERLALKLGHGADSYRIADGSGLSLYNYTSAKIEVSFLRYAYSKKRIYNTLYRTLPSAGIDGTLRRRMGDSEHTRGNVHAKTGSLSCVSTLAGYCRADNGHRLAFCIMNQGVLKSGDARRFQDSICTILCEPYKH